MASASRTQLFWHALSAQKGFLTWPTWSGMSTRTTRTLMTERSHSSTGAHCSSTRVSGHVELLETVDEDDGFNTDECLVTINRKQLEVGLCRSSGGDSLIDIIAFIC